MKNFQWLENWYESHHDGDWEHTYGIRIETIDNPGWKIEIDIAETKFENLEQIFCLIENNENDWHGIEIKNKKYTAVGDIKKLDFLIGKFRNIISTFSKKIIVAFEE
ncbi:MAG: hypothetical protein B6I24_08570 [Bacteroidetes bacterium 4572_128]|nr:MAG: hypothetical protein B6I24_08570 [Bacteroidetes bacterium 4572_128]